MPRVMRVAAAALLFATGGIHLDLYLTGYRFIPTIGVLFILQVIAAAVLGLAVIAVPRRIVAISGALFALSTLGGYVLSLWVGLFGFKEVRTTAGIVAGIVEVGAFVVLGGLATSPISTTSGGERQPETLTDRVAPGGKRLVAPFGVLASLVLAIALIGATPAATGSSGSAGTLPTGNVARVTIHDFAFSPNRVIVRPGETVEITNRDGVAHTFSSMPGDKSKFTSGPIVLNATRTVVAPVVPGTYPYFCQIHPFMTGTLVVQK
jgi:plastocyanin